MAQAARTGPRKGSSMNGNMMQMPLLISALIRHADRYHGDVEIVSRPAVDETHRYTYRDLHRRSRQLANVLTALGVRPSARVGTLAWNTHRHLELYFATSGIGAVINTVNPRLFQEQIEYIVNHAEDEIVFFDLPFAPLVEKIAPRCRGVRAWVALCDRERMPRMSVSGLPLSCYEELVAAQTDDYRRGREFDENTAASLCYTSGTTGNPKGVLFSHRSTLLHTFGISLADSLAVSSRDVVLPVTPMFHVFSWGLPYAACMVGAKLVLPGAQLDGASLYRAIRSGSGDVYQRCSHRLAGLAAISGNAESRAEHPQARRHRRVGLPAGDDRQVCGTRHRGDPRLGHDRDQPRFDDEPAQGQASVAARGQAPSASHQAGPTGFRRRPEDRRQRRQRAAARRRRFRRSDGARSVGRRRVLQRRWRRCAARRLVSDRRRRDARRRRLRADHRPLEGRHQVGRRMDQLDRRRKRSRSHTRRSPRQR